MGHFQAPSCRCAHVKKVIYASLLRNNYKHFMNANNILFHITVDIEV